MELKTERTEVLLHLKEGRVEAMTIFEKGEGKLHIVAPAPREYFEDFYETNKLQS